MRSPRLCIFLALAIWALSGCSTLSELRSGVQPINQGLTAPDGVRIVDVEGGFELSSQSAWQTPFEQGDDCLVDPTPENFGIALQAGARHVRVHHPAHSETLYGVLSLCGRMPFSFGPASRSYLIEIPDSYVEQTSGGRVSVIYEYHRFDEVRRHPQITNPYSRAQTKAWVLWLARAPLDPEFSQPEAEARTLGQALGKRVHQGFFLRFSAGPLYSYASVDADFGHSSASYDFQGMGGEFNLAVGGTVREDLILHASFGLNYDTNPNLSMHQRSNDIDFEYRDVSSARWFIGGGITGYSPSQFFSSMSLGLVAFMPEFVSAESDYTYIIQDMVGVGWESTFGKEWWVHDYWLLGVAGTVMVSSSPDFLMLSTGLRMTVTRN